MQIKFLCNAIKYIGCKFWVLHKFSLLHFLANFIFFFFKKKPFKCFCQDIFLNNTSIWTFSWQSMWFPGSSCWVYPYYINIKLDSLSESINHLQMPTDFISNLQSGSKVILFLHLFSNAYSMGHSTLSKSIANSTLLSELQTFWLNIPSFSWSKESDLKTSHLTWSHFLQYVNLAITALNI